MSRISTANRALFQRTYINCIKNLEDDLIICLNTILEVMDEHNFQNSIDFEAFAKEAFLHHVKNRHKEYKAQEDIIEQVNEILKNPNHDNNY